MQVVKTKCCICLEKDGTSSLYDKIPADVAIGAYYLPRIIEEISGVKIIQDDEPLATICAECTDGIVAAEVIIEKCRESSERRREQKEAPPDVSNIDSAKDQISEKYETSLKEVETKPKKEGKPQLKGVLRSRRSGTGIRIMSLQAETSGGTAQASDQLKKSVPRHLRASAQCRPLPTIGKAERIASHVGLSDTSKDTSVSSQTKQLKKSAPLGRKYVRTVNKNKDFFFRCDDCAYTTHFATYFRAHLQQEHRVAQPRIFKCTQCSRDFLEYRYLKQHIAHDHQQQPRQRQYLCAECGRAFAKSSNLRYHQRTHLPQHRRPPAPSVRCKYCAKEYSQHSIRMHLLTIHAEQRTHACDQCSASFAVAKSLQAHMRTCHPGNVLRCPCCEVKFRVRSVYVAHVQRGACQKLDFNCDYCAWGFKTRERLEKHKRMAHKKLLPVAEPQHGNAANMEIKR